MIVMVKDHISLPVLKVSIWTDIPLIGEVVNNNYTVMMKMYTYLVVGT